MDMRLSSLIGLPFPSHKHFEVFSYSTVFSDI